MAYLGKLGGLLRQNVAKSMLMKAGTGAAAMPAVLVLQRGMASSKLFIGGRLAFRVSDLVCFSLKP